MANPSEDEGGAFCVLVNEEDQYALWWTVMPAPDGWTAVGLRSDRRYHLTSTDANRTDTRPEPERARPNGEKRRRR